MPKVIVIELPDTAEFDAPCAAVRAALPDLPDGSRVYLAVADSADQVLAVFPAEGA